MDITKYIHYLIFISILLSFTSCQTMYLPNMQNVPVFQKKGDIKVNLNLNNYQVAWAPLNKAGLFVNGYYKKRGIFHIDDGKTYDYKVDSYLIEAGLGTFWKFENHSVEIYAGGGKGYGDIQFGMSPRGMGGGLSHYNKIFIQPVIGFGNGPWKFCFSARISFLNFYDFVEYFTDPWQQIYDPTIESNTPFFIEPAFTLSRNINLFRIKGQLQYSIASENAGISAYYSPYKSMLIGAISLEVDLDKLINRKKKK